MWSIATFFDLFQRESDCKTVFSRVSFLLTHNAVYFFSRPDNIVAMDTGNCNVRAFLGNLLLGYVHVKTLLERSADRVTQPQGFLPLTSGRKHKSSAQVQRGGEESHSSRSSNAAVIVSDVPIAAECSVMSLDFLPTVPEQMRR